MKHVLCAAAGAVTIAAEVTLAASLPDQNKDQSSRQKGRYRKNLIWAPTGIKAFYWGFDAALTRSGFSVAILRATLRMPVQVLIVDDHEAMRNGLCSLLSSRQDLVICGQAADGK